MGELLTTAFTMLDAQKALDYWVECSLEDYNQPAYTEMLAEEARPHMEAFFQDNSGKSAEELEELAIALSPGGAQNSAFLSQIVRIADL